MKKFAYNSVLEAFVDHAVNTPGKLFIVEGKKEFTYIESFKAAYGYFKHLEDCGVKAGECVIVKTAQTAATVFTDMAVAMSRAIYVPVEKVVAADRVNYVIEKTDAKIFIADKEMEVNAKWISMKDIYDYKLDCSDEEAVEKAKNLWNEIGAVDGETTGQILFTTGTTGTSKGVEMSNAATVRVAENVVNGIGIEADGVEIIPVPINHAYGLRRFYANVLVGSAVVLMDGIVFIVTLWKAIEKYNASGLTLVPASLAMIFKLSGDKISEYKDTLKYVQIGAAVLPPTDKEKLCELLPKTRLFDFYGCSEAGCVCTADYNEFKDKRKSLGKPTCNAVFKLLLEDGSYVDYPTTGIQGRLCYSGSMRMKGYWREPEMTKEAVKDGFIVTNDLAYFDEDGFIYMLGRADDVINSAGAKIAPTEIEEAMMGCPGVADCAVVGAPDPVAGEVPKLFVVMELGSQLDPVVINNYLFDRLEAYKTPKIIVAIDAIPRTYNGKILRRELKNLN